MKSLSIKSPLMLLVLWAMVFLTACSPIASAFANQNRQPTQPAAGTAPSGGASVTVHDQEYDGTTIVVADVVSVGPGWMVIHNQVNGGLGLPIGYTAVVNGDNKNVVVKIDPAQATATMYAMLHVDAGTVGKYEFPGPDVPSMVNGQMVAPGFKATVQNAASNITPAVTVVDQDVSGGKVVVASVTSSGPGWIAIHVQNADGTPGIEIGYTAVKSGVTPNVVVNIDASKATPVLMAMIHTDAGIIGKYEFPGPDAPEMASGQMVVGNFKTSATAAAAIPTQAMTAMPSATPDTSMAMSTPGANLMVKVSDQPLVSETVMVTDVVSSGPGWIVIYTTNANGQPDQPIGHTAVKDGDNPNVMVAVDPAKAQGTLYAQLHVDKGAVGTFEYPGPDVPVMMGVQMISGAFKITGIATATVPTLAVLLPSVTVADQAVKDGTLTIPQVISNGAWWLVIYRKNPDGSMGDLVGYTMVKNGINTNVVVKIDLAKATPVLYAMLQEDHGVIGTLEYPGPDVPVMVNNQMIAPTFNVTGLALDVNINIRTLSNNVSFLVDGAANSLYISLQDTVGKSNCTGTCLNSWKPLLVSGKVVSGDGVKAANLGVITLPDGTHQVSYLGMPLYTYVKDVNPGDTNGQGVGGVFFLVTP